MFNKILALLFIFIFNSNALADSITTFKCKFDLENYDYTINIYNEKINDLIIRDRSTKSIFHYETLKRSADITVIYKDSSYNFKGFKNGGGKIEHYLYFTDNNHSLYAYLKANNDYDSNNRPKTFQITSFDSGIDSITKGTCDVFY